MATAFDITLTAAAIYAESLLQLADEAGEAEEIGSELWQLRELWTADPGFATLMSSAAIEHDERRASLQRIFGSGRVSPLVLNLLLVLNDRHRTVILPALCEAYRSRLDKRLKREEVHVTSAQPLSDEQRGVLRSRIKQLTGHDTDLFEKVDAQVLGGIAVQIGDRLYDLSLRRELQDLRTTLLEAGERRMLGGVSQFVTEGLTK